MITGGPGARDRERPVGFPIEFILLGCNQLNGTPEYPAALRGYRAGSLTPQRPDFGRLGALRANARASVERPTGNLKTY